MLRLRPDVAEGRAVIGVEPMSYKEYYGVVITQSVRLRDSLAERLEALAGASKRSKSSLIVEALEHYLDEREDLEKALARFRDPATEWVEHDEVRRELDLES